MSCSCFSSSELFILAGGAGDKRQGGRGEGDTGEGEQKARRRWRGVRLHYPEVGIAPAPPAPPSPPPPGAQHAVRSSRAPTSGLRLLHLRRAGLGAGPGRGVGSEGGSGVEAPGRLCVRACGLRCALHCSPDAHAENSRPGFATPELDSGSEPLTNLSRPLSLTGLWPRAGKPLFYTSTGNTLRPDPSRCLLQAVWLIESLHNPGGGRRGSLVTVPPRVSIHHTSVKRGCQDLGPASGTSPCLNCSEDHLVSVGGSSVLGEPGTAL